MTNYKDESIRKFDKALKENKFHLLRDIIVNEFSDGLDSNFIDNILRTKEVSENISIEEQITIMNILRDNNAFQNETERGVCIQLSARYGRCDLLTIIAESNLKMGLRQSIPMLDLPIVEVGSLRTLSPEIKKKTMNTLEKYGCKHMPKIKITRL